MILKGSVFSGTMKYSFVSLHWFSLNHILIYLEIWNNINGGHEIFMLVKKRNELEKND